MFSVEAIPGVSIVIRSQDPNFCPNNMTFVTEYAGTGFNHSIPLQLSVLRETDQNGQLIRIAVVNPNNSGRQNSKAAPLTPLSSYTDMPRIPSPISMSYLARSSSNPNAGYPSPPPSVTTQQARFPQSDCGSSGSSAAQSDVLDFSDLFPGTYGDLDPVLGAGGSPTDQMRSPHEHYFANALMNSSSYTVPSTSSFLTSAPVMHDQPLPPSPHPNHLATPLVSTPCSLPPDDNNNSSSSSSSSSSTTSTFPLSNSLPANHPDQNDPKRIYTCRHDGCEKRFARKYHRQVHENSHKPKVRLLLTCREEECSAKFGRPHDRMRHEVAKHGLRPNYVCKDCGKFFGTESKLRGHKCDLMPSQRHRWTDPGSGEE